MDNLEIYNIVTDVLSALEDSYLQFLDEEEWNDTPIARLAFTNTSIMTIKEERNKLPPEAYSLLRKKLHEMKQAYRASFVEDVMNYIKRPQE